MMLFCRGQSESLLLFGSLGQACGSILSDVKDQELVLPATCHNQQKNISAIPSISTRVFPFEISYIKVQSPKVFQVVLRNFQEQICLKQFSERRTRCKENYEDWPRFTSRKKGHEMRIRFLVSVIVCFGLSVDSAPLDVRVAKELSSRLHRRQIANQGYPGYPGYATSTPQYNTNEIIASQVGSIPSQASNSTMWNSSLQATVASTATTQSGQQQLATQNGTQVVPAQANYSSTQPSLTSADKTFSNDSSSTLELTSQQSSVSSYAALPTQNSTIDNRYPVYYVSNYEDPNTQQSTSQPVSNTTINPSVLSLQWKNNTTQNASNNSYPVFYVASPPNEEQQAQVFSNSSSPPATSTESPSRNNGTHNYPIYYVSNYNEETTQTPIAPTVSSTNTFANTSKENNTLNEQAYSYPVYNVGGPKVEQQSTSQESKFINSPISYKIINSSSVSQSNASQPNFGSSSSATTLSNTTQPSAASGSSSSPPEAAAPSTSQTTSAPASQPANPSYNYPWAPASYQTNKVTPAPSTPQQASNYYGSPESAASPATYQAYGAPSTSVYPAPAPAPQPAPSYYNYPANQASAAPSSSASPAQSPAQPAVASSYTSTALSPAPTPSPPPAPAPEPAPAPASAPASAPAPALTTAPASEPNRISGVSSSPPYPPSSASSSSPGTQSPPNTQASSSVAEPSPPSLPVLNSEYENASYIIATPPDKDTVLFLPSPSHPFSSETTQTENATIVSTSTLAVTNASAESSSSPAINATSLVNATAPEIIVHVNATSSKVESSNSTVPASQVTNSSVKVIPQNISFPGLGWLEKNNTSFSSMTNSSLETPSSTLAPKNPISSTTPRPQPPSATTAPIIMVSPFAPALDNTSPATVVPSHSNGTLNSPPLGPQLNSPPIVMTKPPPSHLSPTPPPAPAPVVHPVQVTAKPPAAVVLHTTSKPKPKEWGFGDKYLASQNQRARHRNVIFDGIAGDSQSYSNYQVLSQQDVFFPKHGRKRRNLPAT